MRSLTGRTRGAAVLLVIIIAAYPALAGVSRAVQERYRRDYGSKAFFLRQPVSGERKYILISGRTFRPEPDPPGTARFKVGEQVRITAIEFGGDEIRFRISAITGASLAEIIYKFDTELQEDFPNSEVFDRAIQATFTEGLKYSDIEDAKKSYVEDALERYVRETAALTNSSREAVLRSMAALLPAYQDAMRDIENLKRRNQDLSGQLTDSQQESRKLETELKGQQAEVVRLRSANSALQEKIDVSASELRHLGDEVRTARGVTQGYQRELSSLQQSLNIKVDSSRDLGSQISELAQAMRRIQRENANLSSKIQSASANLASLQTANARLTKQVEELEASNRQKSETIASLTSKEDSLARQYLELKKVKENLENITRAVGSLGTKVQGEQSEAGLRTGRINVYLRDVHVGSIEYRLPERLSLQEGREAEVAFATESIDYVRLSPEERQVLRSLGDKLKLEVRLMPAAPTLSVKPEGSDEPKEVGERERAAWRWKLVNLGTSDARLVLSVGFVNRNSDRVPLFRHEQLVSSTNLVRQIRESLSLIPVAIGILVGFALFAIGGVFRRFTRQHHPVPDSPRHAGPKQL